MESKIIAGNLTLPETFEFLENPMMQWMPKEKYSEVTGIPIRNKDNKSNYEFNKNYWTGRDLYYAQAINSGKITQLAFHNNVTFIADKEKENIWNNQSAWKTLNKITSGESNGNILSFDTETIGDIKLDKEFNKKTFGITEIGISTKKFGRAHNLGLSDIGVPDASFVFGIDSEQSQWLREALEKKRNGEALTKAEIWNLERASRYSTIEHDGMVFKPEEIEWSWKQGQSDKFTIAKSLNISNPDSIQDIESGINALEKLYTNDREKQISSIVEFINDSQANRKNTVIAGQNLQYDIEVFDHYNKYHGTTNLDDIKYVDTMNAVKAYAQSRNQTVGDYIKELNQSVTNKRFGSLEAFIETISQSTDYQKFGAHMAFQDAASVIDFLLYNQNNIVGVTNNLIESSKIIPNELSLQDSLIKIKSRGYSRSNDWVTINGEISTGYSVGNQYWKFIGSGTNDFEPLTQTINGKEVVLKGGEKGRYVAQFVNAHNDGAILTKSFDSENDFLNFISYNTNIENPSDVDLVAAQRNHDLDITRRTIDGFFEPKITQANGNINGGYSDFKQYYTIYRDLASLSNEAVKSMELVSKNGKQIKTVRGLLGNISTEDNIAKILEYADENKIESISNFFKEQEKRKDKTARQITDIYYNNRLRLQGAVDTFQQNKEFFEYLNNIQVGNTEEDIIRATIASKELRDMYLSSSLSDTSKHIKYTIDDLNSISLRTSGDEFINVDLTRNTASRIYSAFGGDTAGSVKVTNALINTIEDLTERGLLTRYQQNELFVNFGSGEHAYALAESLANQLRLNTEEIRKNGLQNFIEVREDIENAGGLREYLRDNKNLTPEEKRLVEAIANKNHRTLSESAMSTMQATAGTLDDNFRKQADTIVHRTFDKISVTNTFLDSSSENLSDEIKKSLKALNYEEEEIDAFMGILYKNPKEWNKSALENFNKGLAEEERIKPMYFRTAGKESSDYMIFTTQKQQQRLQAKLSELSDTANGKEIKEAISKYGAYYEIPYLEKIDLGITDDAMASLTKGGKTQVTLVKQGDFGYKKYSTMGLNIWKKGEKGKWTGNIKNSGGEFLTNIRVHAQEAYQLVSEGNNDSAIRLLNNINIANIAEDSAPQFIGSPNADGSLSRKHILTQKDIDYAHMFSLKEDNSKNIMDIMHDIPILETGKTSNQGEKTITALYEVFRDEYDLGIKNRNNIVETNARNVGMVFNSEQFQTFYSKHLTRQAGGIGQEALIRRYIERGGANAEILRASQDKSLLQIMADAVQDERFFEKDLAETFNVLAYKVPLNAIGTEKMTKDQKVFVDYYMEQNNNNRLSGSYRPTLDQRSNYRPYYMNGLYFDEIARDFEQNLGIRFGDVYAPKNFLDSIDKFDMETSGLEKLTEDTVSHRNIIGAVQSISPAELKNGYQEGLDYLLKNNKDLNPEVLKNVYKRMMGDLNTYEGKGYMRPSLANQNFFTIGDTKTIKNSEIMDIIQNGDETEKALTTKTLTDLAGQKISNGTVIGYKRRINRTREEYFKPIYYNGPTINNLTKQNVEELANIGRTVVTTDRQLGDYKLMVDQEKMTVESLIYYSGITEAEKDADLRRTLKNLGFKDYTNNSFTENVRLINRYTDAAFNAISRTNETDYATTLLFNGNINKHITDVPFSSKWNFINEQFSRSEEAYNELIDIIGTGSDALRLSDGSLYVDHLSYHPIRRAIEFDNPLDSGSVNTLDALVMRLRKSNNARAQKVISNIDRAAKGNVSLSAIQRQQMQTYQGESFKMDSRVYHTLITQGEDNYTTGNGAMLAEHIRSSIKEGRYDNTIIGATGLRSTKTSDKIWHDIVMSRRGILSPKKEEEMMLGIMESLEFLEKGADINLIKNKNIINLNAKEILANIPEGGSSSETYKNFIFKTGDGQFTPYIKSRAKMGTNNFEINANSNSFYLDLSDFGELKFEKKNIKGILLPWQQINEVGDELFIANSTKNTISFLNTLKRNQGGTAEERKNIQEALNDLFNAYERELHSKDKESLISKQNLRMKMPNSSGMLAMDAVVPVIQDDGLLTTIRTLENDIANEMGSISSKDYFNKAIKLKEAYQQLSTKVEKQAKNIIDSDNPVSMLNLSGGKYILDEKTKKEINLYERYITKFNEGTGKPIKGIESAVVVGKQMFYDTEMDLGHIGHQVLTDFATNKKSNFDDFSKVTRSKFYVHDKEIQETLTDLLSSFSDTEHEQWAKNTEKALNIYFKENNYNRAVKVFNYEMERYLNDRDAFRVKTMGANLNVRGMDKALRIQAKREFVQQIYGGFENIGSRYASEVGILGLVNRYPNINPTSTLPVRIFLDEAIQGKEGRFLGPQFSIWQNLDFDGDNEFLKFLGNGGLLAKNAFKDIANGKSEYDLMKAQFNYMNEMNLGVFVQSLEDSTKSYRIADDTAFKATLLENLDEARYKLAEQEFLSTLSESELGELDEKIKGLTKEEVNARRSAKKYLVDHSQQMINQYKKFDEEIGSSVSNEKMIQAAIQARIAKNYIGNYSKPNLDIRETMTYMLSEVESGSEEEKQLIKIKQALFGFDDKNIYKDNKPGANGLLTELEQKGIDTKHVHDAEELNNSTAWREGVRKLFQNANGAEEFGIKVNPLQRENAVKSLVTGSYKVYFSKADSIESITNEILNKTFDDYTKDIAKAYEDLKNNQIEKIDDILFGKTYIRGLYEMSLMNNAYRGYNNTFDKIFANEVASKISDLTNDEISKITTELENKGLFSLGNVHKYATFKALKDNRTDEVFTAFNRAIHKGDILAVASENGPQGYIFDQIIKGEKGFFAVFQDYNFQTGEIGRANHYVGNGISIKDLNEEIKKNGIHNRRLLDFSRPDFYEKNVNNIYLNNLHSPKEINAIKKHAASLYVEDQLQSLFNNRDGKYFNSYFNTLTGSKGIQIPSYDSRGVNTIIGDIVGFDAEAFRKRADMLESYLQYGIDNRYIRGVDDAKTLIRKINKSIAENPKKNIDMLAVTPVELVTSLMQEVKDVHFAGGEWLSRDLNDVKRSVDIQKEIANRVQNRERNINLYGEEFINELSKNPSIEQDLFNKAERSYQKEILSTQKDIFDIIKKIPEANRLQEMSRAFGWDAFNPDKNFIINLSGGKIRANQIDLDLNLPTAKVGYGSLIGTNIQDLTSGQVSHILNKELTDEVLANLDRSSIEYVAAINTKELLSRARNLPNNVNTLNFSSSDTLKSSYHVLHTETEEQMKNAEKAAQEFAREAAQKEVEEASKNIKKKTLLSGIQEAMGDITPKTKKYLKIGGVAAAGLATLGLISHASLENKSDSNNVEIPSSIERTVNTTSDGHKIISNKNNLRYENAPSESQMIHKRRKQEKKMAPPSVKRTRTIYHDQKSGFDFKVSANSYNKLQEQSYKEMATLAGSRGDNKLTVTRDNSRITDNWLDNKFSELTE